MNSTTDVQAMILDEGFRISRVGITGVQKPIRVKRNEREVDLTTTIDVFVDLPSTHRGSHMSRNAEIINEVVDDSVRKPVSSLEWLAEDIAERLLQKHEYATTADAWLRATYFMEKKNPSGHSTLEPYILLAKGRANRNGERMKMVGVEVVGMNACPCAMENIRYELKKDYPRHEAAIDEMPCPTHNQRNITTLLMEVPSGTTVEADDLIRIVEGGMSSPTYEILKRNDEAKIVYDAHKKPRFVEDIVRAILSSILEEYIGLPEDVKIVVKSESQESIHKHNALAERITTLGELRA
ncbi:MAG: GTP cyclohydrolase I FolE2 [Thermoplasmata archaeon]|nr:GTP cyclohydrolase I FolE2 [Thermoplasmata archaeon]